MAASSSAESAAAAAAGGERVPFWVLLNGVSKAKNVGNIMRSACAFGAKALVVVGKGHVATFGSKGTNKHVEVIRFEALEAAIEHFHALGARILGVEITSDALSVADEPFDGPTVLMMGNEGHGLTDKQKAVCDGFVYIPHFGNGTASLNVSVAAGVVMHRFASWARYTEHKREEGADKFLVEKGPDPATRPRTEAELALREERRARREAKAAEAAAQGSSSSSSSAAAEATA
ncbi:hypothetical protein FNF27_00974 [Cafeteria roenbergensis]|uniref:tRNA/rRNA methyltransferase SpoU type domain-containing protein n=1 Tax=Cafeteria roenbergensis TaxID=33653 RepID=A0A5A8E0A4_CAFRO|nr:hypothetical protein FNF28_00948 [Cafeteria roenbergensis]KAA0177803.1 hypothetical protein FNF27_00974 [Cafeteria roenbergensis]